MSRRGVSWLLVCLSVLGPALFAHAAEERLSRGQVAYVPTYSEIPFGEGGSAVSLTTTLSIRNTDRKSAITVTRLDYYDSAGKLVRSYLREPRSVGPLSSVEYVVKESDRRGGISASFLLEWASDSPATPPLIQAVMISARSAQGISFVTSARVLEERQ